jgi:nitrite reductase (NO-forming)
VPRIPFHNVRRSLGAALAVTVLAGGCGDDSPGSDLSAVEGPVSPKLEVHATEMQYDPDEIAVKAGNVQVVLHNDGTVLHDLRIEDQPFVIEAGAGQTTTSQITLGAGRYQIFCSIPGHREAGMTGVLEVR